MVATMQRFHVRFGWVAAGALAALGDVLSTWWALRMGMSEGNPSAAWVFATFGFWPGSALLLLPWSVIVAAAAVRGHSPAMRAANLTGYAAIVFRFLVVASNLRLIVGAL